MAAVVAHQTHDWSADVTHAPAVLSPPSPMRHFNLRGLCCLPTSLSGDARLDLPPPPLPHRPSGHSPPHALRLLFPLLPSAFRGEGLSEDDPEHVESPKSLSGVLPSGIS